MPFYILNFHKPIHFTLLDIVLHCLLKTQLPEDRQPLTPYYKVPLIIERNQYVQPKMARSRPTSHQTLDSRFESIRRPRMIKPPVSEARRWVTLESPDLKPIHKQEYKYGYNPYF